jgi:hypothetical protein
MEYCEQLFSGFARQSGNGLISVHLKDDMLPNSQRLKESDVSEIEFQISQAIRSLKITPISPSKNIEKLIVESIG